MSRQLDTATLDVAAQHYAAMMIQPDRKSPSGNWISGPSLIRRDFFAFDFGDEFAYLVDGIKARMGAQTLKEFEALANEHFAPRKDATLKKMLLEKLAIDPDGNHVDGAIGTVKVDGRLIGTHVVEVEPLDSIIRRRRLGLDKSHRETVPIVAKLVWPIYAGEGEERAAGSRRPDPLPPGTPPLPVGALVTRIANVNAIAMCDAMVDLLDGGSAGATIQGRTGGQPADPDTAVTGTNLFTCTASATAFGAASDAAPGGIATAASITDDTSADATGTLGYCRASSSNAADTPLVDQIDGEAGTSGADWNFNTLAIVSAATVSITSWTVTQPES